MIGEEVDPQLKAWCEARGGDWPIQSVLIASNGMAAIKFIKSIRQWCLETFGNDRLIKMVVMGSGEDVAAGAEFIRQADQEVEVAAGKNIYNYANVDLIVELADRLGVQVKIALLISKGSLGWLGTRLRESQITGATSKSTPQGGFHWAHCQGHACLG